MIRKVCLFGPKKKMRFMQTESVLQTKNRSGPAKNRFSVALVLIYTRSMYLMHIIFGQFLTELWPLIEVRILFMLNIL